VLLHALCTASKTAPKVVKNSAKSDQKGWFWGTGLRTGLISALNRQNRDFACFHDGLPLKTAQKQLKNSKKTAKKQRFLSHLSRDTCMKTSARKA
jgi:hypothetical protein